MRCPKCGTLDDKVIDSRLAKDGSSIRRRRVCLECEARFTTYEVLERNEMRLEKKDGRRELFDRAKLLGSITKACEKRPISMEDMERVAEEIHRELDSLNDAEVTSRQLGKLVMEPTSSSSDEFAKTIKADTDRWGVIAKRLNYQPVDA